MVQNPNTQNTKTENKPNSWQTNIAIFVIVFLYVLLLILPFFWTKPTDVQWQIARSIIVCFQYLAWFFTVILLVAYAFGATAFTNFTTQSKTGAGNLKDILLAYSPTIESLNKIINWKAIRETLGFGFVFGIFSNLFYPQILNFSIGEISPLAWLKFDHNSKPLFLQISKYWDKEIFVEMLKSGTVNLIVICATILIVAFVGGSKMLNVALDYVAKIKNNGG